MFRLAIEDGYSIQHMQTIGFNSKGSLQLRTIRRTLVKKLEKFSDLSNFCPISERWSHVLIYLPDVLEQDTDTPICLSQ